MEKVIGYIVGGVAAILWILLKLIWWSILLAWPVQIFWNAVVPKIFHLQELSFFDALWLTLLINFLRNNLLSYHQKD